MQEEEASVSRIEKEQRIRAYREEWERRKREEDEEEDRA